MFGSSLWEMEAAGLDLTLTMALEALGKDAQSAINGERSCRVLDVGCGSGQFLRALLKRKPGLDAVGVDPYGIEGDRGGVRFQRLGAEDIGGMLERFDLVVTSMSLHHFRDVGAFFQAAALAVRWHTGRLLVVDWKKGVDTGIPEDYFHARGIADRLAASGWSVIAHREEQWHFAILARPRKYRFAVALGEDGMVAKGMLGTAPRFGIFDWNDGEIEEVTVRPNPYEKTRQHLKTLDVAQYLSDASLLVASRIGPRGKERLRARGIRMVLSGGPAPLSAVFEYLSAVFDSMGKGLDSVGDRERRDRKFEVL